MSEEAPQDKPVKPSDGASTDRRTKTERRAGDRRVQAKPVAQERREGAERRSSVSRRKRSMNQYDMEAEVLEFVNAVNQFKERSGRAFPTWSEVLEILKSLGYQKPEA